MSYIFEHEIPRKNKVASIATRWIEAKRGEHINVGNALRDAGYNVSDDDCAGYVINVVNSIASGQITENRKIERIIANVLHSLVID